MLEYWLARVWDNVISRPGGPMQFRFLLQPAMAIFFAVRSGLNDSREGKPAYVWALFVDSAHRRELLRDGWKAVGKVFVAGLVLDCAYQIFVMRWIYPGEAILIAFVLAIVPYLLVRGPVNRIAGACKPTAHSSAAGRP